jgi:hypothetical protein
VQLPTRPFALCAPASKCHGRNFEAEYNNPASFFCHGNLRRAAMPRSLPFGRQLQTTLVSFVVQNSQGKNDRDVIFAPNSKFANDRDATHPPFRRKFFQRRTGRREGERVFGGG